MAVTLSLFAGAGAQFFDNNGVILSGGLVYTYAAGTTTPLAAYTSNTGATALANPIVLDAAGRVPTGEIWLTYGQGYKFTVKTSTDVLIGTYDNIPTAALPPLVNDAASIAYEQGASVTAGNFIIGQTYLITSIGSTNFQSIGAVSNTVGIYFTATGVGSGTGTAEISRTVQAKLQDSISLLDFGAIGDGVTNDYAAILAALTAATGKTLCIPSGYVFASSTRIQIPSNIIIYGGGTLKALPLGTSATIQGFLYGASLSNVTIDGITIDSNPSAQTHPLLAAVYFTASSNINFMNNKVTCSYSGVYIRSNSNLVTVSNNYIDNSYGSTTDTLLRHNPSIIVGANNSTVENNRVIGVLSTVVADSLIATGITVGADGSGSTYRNITVTGNTVQNTYTAIAGSTVFNLTITGNTLSDCRTANHSQAVLLTSCVGANVVGNACYNVDYTAIAFVDCSQSTIANNTITNSSTFLVGAASNEANGITSNAGDSNVITGNTITFDGVTAGAIGRAIISYGNNCIIQNNTVQTLNMALGYGAQIYGSYNTISDNVFRVGYIGIRMLLFVGVPTQYNTIQNNIIEVTSASKLWLILDQSEGPNRYVNNFYKNSNDVTSSFTNNHYFNRDNGKDTLLSKTADYTLAVEDSYKQINNAAATGTVIFNLPDATSSSTNRPFGLVYKIYRIVNQIIRIEPLGTNVIRGGGAGKYLELDNNASVELICETSGAWEIINSNGTYTFEP